MGTRLIALKAHVNWRLIFGSYSAILKASMAGPLVEGTTEAHWDLLLFLKEGGHITSLEQDAKKLREEGKDAQAYYCSKAAEDGKKHHLLLPNIFEGPALDISSRNEAGAEALRALDIPKVESICLKVDPDLPFKERLEQREANKRALVEKLWNIPGDSIRLVTIFDHSNGLIGTEAGREITRILMHGGQRIITARDLNETPRHDEPVPDLTHLYPDNLTSRSWGVLAWANDLPNLGQVWFGCPREHYPNVMVSIYTKPGGR